MVSLPLRNYNSGIRLHKSSLKRLDFARLLLVLHLANLDSLVVDIMVDDFLDGHDGLVSQVLVLKHCEENMSVNWIKCNKS